MLTKKAIAQGNERILRAINALDSRTEGGSVMGISWSP
jgi:hypothetical protein